MNDDRDWNDDELRLATSRSLPAGVTLDAETAALRESFVALGSALEAAEGAFDEAGLIERLKTQARSASEGSFSTLDEAALVAPSKNAGATDEHGFSRIKQATCSPFSVSSEKSAARWGALLLGAALAASALFAIVRIATEWRQVDRAAVVVVKAPSHAAVAKSDVPETAPLGVGWNDPLDDEIALAAATMGQFSAGRRGLDKSLFEMNQELAALSLELWGESL